MKQIFNRVLDSSPDLPIDKKSITYFEWSFTVYEPSIFRASGHIDVHHRGLKDTIDQPVMATVNLQMDGKWIPGAKTGGNVRDQKHHYMIIPVHAFMILEAGDHTVTLWMRSASSAAPETNGLIEIKGAYNNVVYEVEPLGDSIIYT